MFSRISVLKKICLDSTCENDLDIQPITIYKIKNHLLKANFGKWLNIDIILGVQQKSSHVPMVTTKIWIAK